MNITDEQDAYVKSIYQSLVDKGIRTELDTRNEKLSMKIREGVVKKVPYMVIAGKKEMNSNTLTVRMRDGNELKDVRLDDFIERIQVDNISRR